jgi:hypothetical protein
MNEDIFNGFGIEVFIDENDFLKIKETLSRIGVLSKKDKTLYQSCHILHKQGRYVIIHFKELFGLDNKIHDISENDLARRNTIVNLLEDWELLEIRYPESCSSPLVLISQIKILSFKEKSEYTLVSKYNIGKVKK